jgi:ABC-type transport system involved in multi-copper enzyme maturation permease subunit
MELVLGKFLGGAIVLFCYTCIMGILLVLSSLYLTGKVEPADGYQAGFIFFKLIIRGSIAMALSMIIRPIIASIITVFLAGDIFSSIAMLFPKTPVIHYPSLILYYLLPSYSVFDTKTLGSFLGMGNPDLSIHAILCKTGYAIDMTVIMLIVTIVLFNKKDLIQ